MKEIEENTISTWFTRRARLVSMITALVLTMVVLAAISFWGQSPEATMGLLGQRLVLGGLVATGLVTSGILTMTVRRLTENLNQAAIHRETTRQDRRELMATVSQLTNQLSTATVELLAMSAQQNAGAEQQLTSVTETVATVEEVSLTSEQAAERARTVSEAASRAEGVGQQGQEAVQQMMEGIGTARQRVETTSEKMATLVEQAGQIRSIIATVDHIAEQTNLLALNASIEAARAGENGRGFSVIATEIKALAERSRRATGEVQEILGTIEVASGEALEATDESRVSLDATVELSRSTGHTIDALMATLGETADAATVILGSTREQAIGVKQIQEAMQTIENVVEETRTATAQVETAVGGLTSMIDHLEGHLETAS